MSRLELIGMVLSYVYAFSLLLIVEAVGKKMNWPQHISRKIIHIGAGMWVWGILYFFDELRWGIIPFATFILLNYLFYRRQTFAQMDVDKSTPGTVYFSLSITLIFLMLWRPSGPLDLIPVGIAGLMAMTWGDACASLVGQPWGRKKFQAFGHTRSFLGSVTMAAVSLVAIWLTLTLLPGSALSPMSPAIGLADRLLLTILGATVATLAEALSPAGTDNLTVPLASSFFMWLIYP
ncbi:MAG TPA: phosphatidate cytidylyltransferase [bacterium]|nr:phosphatidate cytidylyltransferase [bacterium]